MQMDWLTCSNTKSNTFPLTRKNSGVKQLKITKYGGHSRKHPYHPHGGNGKLTPLSPSDVLIHLLLSETIFSLLPLRTAEISSVGGVWIFSGTTHCSLTCSNSIITNCKSLIVIPIQTQNLVIIQ